MISRTARVLKQTDEYVEIEVIHYRLPRPTKPFRKTAIGDGTTRAMRI